MDLLATLKFIGIGLSGVAVMCVIFGLAYLIIRDK